MKAINPQQLRIKATDIFTDREAPRAAFWQVYNSMEYGDIEIINYYGIGGIGKTSLLKQIQLELDNYGNKKHVEFSFESQKSKERVLFDLSRQLMKKCEGLRFPIFDFAFEKYQILSGEEQLGKQLLEKESVLDHHLVGSTIAAVSDFVPFGGTISSALTEGAKALQKLAKKYEQIKGANADIYNEISYIDTPNELYRRLQYYFSLDAYAYFINRKEKAPLVILLDGYEVLVNRLQKGDKASSDDLWLREQGGLITSIPNAIWVIAGREKLEWGEDYIPQDHSHLIGNLSRKDAISFFEASGITDADLAEELYELTGGTPVYMDLCVKQYNSFIALHDGMKPLSGDFGNNTEEIAVRFLRDMSIMEQGILHILACLPNTWDDELVINLVEKLHYDFSSNEYKLIKDMTLVETVDQEQTVFKLHETFRKIVYSQIRETEKTNILNALKDILVSKLVSDESVDRHHYYLRSVVELYKRDYRLLTLSYDDSRKISWAISRDYISNEAEYDDFEFFKEVVRTTKDAEWIKKYTAIARRQIESLNYKDNNAEALSVAKALYEMCGNEESDAETKAIISYLYGCRLYISEYFEECRSYLTSAMELATTKDEISYSCKRSILQMFADYIRYYREDKKEHDSIQMRLIQECDKELERLNANVSIDKRERAIERVMLDKARAFYYSGNDEQALAVLNTLYNSMIQTDSTFVSLCNCKQKMALIHFDMEQYWEAANLLQEILTIYDQNEVDEDEYNSIYSLVSQCYLYLRRYDDALDYAQKALSIAKIAFGEDSIDVADKYLLIAQVNRAVGEDKNTEEYMIKACIIKSKVLGPNDSDTCEALEELAGYYSFSEKNDKAVEIWEDLYERYKKIFGENHSKTIHALYSIGDKYIATEDYESARKIEEKAFNMLMENGDRDGCEVSDMAHDLAATCYMVDDYEAAKKYEEIALAVLEGDKYKDKRRLNDALYQYYEIFAALEDTTNAYNTILKLFNILKADIDFWKDDYWRAYSCLADCNRERGEVLKALEIHQECLSHYTAEGDKENKISARLAISEDYDALNKHEESLACDLQTYKMACDLYGEKDPEAIYVYKKVAFDYMNLGNKAKAKRIRDEILLLEKDE